MANECPQRVKYLENSEKTARIFSGNSNWITKQAAKKKDEMSRANIDNTPESSSMPVLHYKYIMNEPFLNGTKDQYQESTDVNSYIIKSKLNIDGVKVKKQEEMLDYVKTVALSKEFQIWKGNQILFTLDITEILLSK